MDPNSRLLALGAGGAPAVEPVYVEDVFSTWLYTGNSSTQTITNGIDLSGEGGLVWTKLRDFGSITNTNYYDHWLTDTVRGAGQTALNANTTDAQGATIFDDQISSFNNDGFTLTSIGSVAASSTGTSWTFRKAEKFFDIVTYTGNGTTQEINHNLGSTPGLIIIKRTNGSASWCVWHRGNGSTFYTLILNSTDSNISSTYNSGQAVLVSAPTSTSFTVKTPGFDSQATNASGDTYVAYLFAHDAGGFGDDGTESVIECGSYDGGSGNIQVSLGFEPQFILRKNITSAGNWVICDTMRGMPIGGAKTASLFPNLTNAETVGSSLGYLYPTSTGFVDGNSSTGNTYVYIAIRRGPMKTPTDATKVFDVDAQAGASFVTTSFPVDLSVLKRRNNAETTYALSRLQGGAQYLEVASTISEQTAGSNPIIRFDSNVGIEDDFFPSGSDLAYFNFRRAPDFFDMVAYTGTGSATTVNHGLGVAPELMIVKRRNSTEAWAVYSSSLPASDRLRFNTDGGAASISAYWNSTAPTSSVFTVGSDNATNASGSTYIAYLFATCPGVSKVGSYTGTGTTLNVDCGFTAGARFVLIKRTDDSGDWYVWDAARGIVSGNDPYFLINKTAVEVTSTDYIDPLSSGFQISSSAPDAINQSGGSFIFLAIA